MARSHRLPHRVIAFLQRIFTAPVYPGDAPRTLRSRLFNIGYLFCSGWLTLTMIGNFLGRQIHPTITALMLVALTLGLVPYYWARRGRLEAGAKIWLVFAFFVATLGFAMLGTIRAPALGFYLILVISSGFVFGRRAMALMVVMSSAAVAGLIYAENAGWLPRPDYRVTITQWITATALFACVGSMTMAATRVMREAQEQAEREVEERRRTEIELREANKKLEEALHSVRTLKGLLPVCAWCHKVREDEGYWSQLESYITAHTDTTFTHGICPECSAKQFRNTPTCEKK